MNTIQPVRLEEMQEERDISDILREREATYERDKDAARPSADVFRRILESAHR
jgi:hypothetical protein